jgi:hypothetical protein
MMVTPIPNYTVEVSGPAWQLVSVLVIEGGLFLTGVPGGGYDIDPFEANSALVYREYSGVLGGDGKLELAVELSRSHAEGGLNYIVATFDNYYGLTGLVSEPFVIEQASGP